MLTDASEFDFATVSNYDLVIVGAGAVGLTMAVSSVKRGLKVMVVEAGPAKPTANSQAFFENAIATGHALPGLHVGRFRCLGGTTNFWGGQLVPFAPVVFGERPWVSDARWPITRDELEPYYRKAFDILGMSTVIESDADVWEALGVQSPPKTDRIQPIFTRWTPESNLALAFQNEIARSPNLTVLLNCQVGAIAIDGQKRACGVQVHFLDRPPVVVHAKKIALAAGTIETIRLLKLPDPQGQPTPWSSNEWLGRGFMDHIDCYGGTVVPLDRKRFANLFDNAFLSGLKYSPKLRLSDEKQAEEEMLEISSHFVFRSSMAEHIANLKILVKGLMKGRLDRQAAANPLGLFSALRFVVPMALRYIRYRRMTNFADGGIQLRLTAEQRPMRESSVCLSEDADRFGIPKVEVNWKIDHSDLTSLAKFAAYLKDYLETSGLARVELDQGLMAGQSSFLDKIDDANHQMGGARMGASANEGVVDTNCAVFSTENLFVAGAAVYPVSGFANPTFTAIALGLRLVDHIAAQSENGDTRAAVA